MVPTETMAGRSWPTVLMIGLSANCRYERCPQLISVAGCDESQDRERLVWRMRRPVRPASRAPPIGPMM